MRLRERTAPRAEGARPRPDLCPSLRPACRGLAHPCGFSFPRSRAGTMSADTASGPTEDQVEILEYNFNKVNKHPDPTTLCLIAAEAGLSEEETQVSPARAPRPPPPGRSRGCGGPPRPRLQSRRPPPTFHRSARTPGAPSREPRPCIAPTAAPEVPGSMGTHLRLHPQPAGPPPGAA